MKTVCLLLVAFAGCACGHDWYGGECPTFPPMKGFDWDRFSEGRWYAIEKFDTHRSHCNTYDFVSDEFGKKVVQTSEVKGLRKVLRLENKIRYTGRLAAPYSATPAEMEVRFELNPFGSATYVVMNTDYDNYALLCSCQPVNLLLALGHRRSCTILQREPIYDPAISKDLHSFLNKAMLSKDFDHDFDRVSHANCQYSDDIGIKLDISKILSDTRGEVSSAFDDVSDVVKDIKDAFDDEADDKPEREELEEQLMPIKEKSPDV